MILNVRPEVVDTVYRLAQAAEHDPAACRALADLCDRYGADMVAGRHRDQWRALADHIEHRDATPETIMTAHRSPDRALYTGTRPSSLRVEWMSDRVRFRIEGPGQDDAIVDLTGAAVDDLVDTLTARPDELR